MMMPQHKNIRSELTRLGSQKVPECVGPGVGQKKNACSLRVQTNDERLVIGDSGIIAK